MADDQDKGKGQASQQAKQPGAQDQTRRQQPELYPKTATAEERQRVQAHRLSPEERQRADQEAQQARRQELEEQSQQARQAASESKRAHLDSWYVGDTPVEIVRQAKEDDVNFHPTEPRSVVRWPDGTEKVFRDHEITAEPNPTTGRVFGVGSDRPYPQTQDLIRSRGHVA